MSLLSTSVPLLSTSVPLLSTSVPSLYLCPPSLYLCVPSLYLCVPSLYLCVPSLYLCVPSLYLCVPSLYLCPPSLYLCPPSLYLCPFSLPLSLLSTSVPSLYLCPFSLPLSPFSLPLSPFSLPLSLLSTSVSLLSTSAPSLYLCPFSLPLPLLSTSAPSLYLHPPLSILLSSSPFLSTSIILPLSLNPYPPFSTPTLLSFVSLPLSLLPPSSSLLSLHLPLLSTSILLPFVSASILVPFPHFPPLHHPHHHHPQEIPDNKCQHLRPHCLSAVCVCAVRYQVTVQPNVDSLRLGLSGTFTLSVSPGGLSLRTPTPAPPSLRATRSLDRKADPLLSLPPSVHWADQEGSRASLTGGHCAGEAAEEREVEVLAWKLSMLKKFDVDKEGASGRLRVFVLDCGP